MTIHLQSAAHEACEIVEFKPHLSGYRGTFKRVFDIVFVVCSLPVVLPVILIFSFLVALDGRNPFFVQIRVGKDGRQFRMFKLRSMVADAEARLLEHLASNPDAKREWDEKQKLCNDPRITLVGRIIRKTSIDELPQFLNVLIGDMSMVGPRPMLPSQRELYPGKAYYMLLPGVTGFWQIGDRHETSFAARSHYDEDYYRALSFRTDLRVIFKTFGAICRGTGA
ncbi:sugar transferase [Mangrovicoccus ximenensis]|uniref:sugar transferase n=1 Tax=Mangrovicoccus ximenensis TaxID=1911570 RepID=UPI000D359638|nr:sugar transferase [Mangrovicoccus ximenensis]